MTMAKADSAPTMPVSGLTNSTRRESDDGYRFVIARLSDRWRVIECRDGIQWIIQHIDGKRHGETRWTGFRYLRTRDRLIASCRRSVPEIDPSALAILQSLPERI
jgi:hypothetical protein